MQTATSIQKIKFWILTAFAVLALLWPWSNQQVSAATPPPNDDFDSAIVIGSLPYLHSQVTNGATPATVHDKTTPGSPGYDEPQPTCIDNTMGFNIVWYRFTPASSGRVTFETFGSNYDTVLNIWTGRRGSLTSVRCNDDGGLDYDSRLQIPVVAGTTYYVEIAGFHVTDFGNLVLKASWFGKSGPANGTDYVSMNPTLDWTPSPEVISYEVCYDEVQNNTCEGTWTSVGTATNIQLTNLSFETTYYWQVRANTPTDTFTADSNVWWSFKTGFGKIDPLNESIDEPVPTLQLSWNTHPNATAYEYCYDQINNGSCDGSWTSTGMTTHADINGLVRNKTYYWQVRTSTASGTIGANGGGWWSFTTVDYMHIYLPTVLR